MHSMRNNDDRFSFGLLTGSPVFFSSFFFWIKKMEKKCCWNEYSPIPSHQWSQNDDGKCKERKRRRREKNVFYSLRFSSSVSGQKWASCAYVCMPCGGRWWRYIARLSKVFPHSSSIHPEYPYIFFLPTSAIVKKQRTTYFTSFPFAFSQSVFDSLFLSFRHFFFLVVIPFLCCGNNKRALLLCVSLCVCAQMYNNNKTNHKTCQTDVYGWATKKRSHFFPFSLIPMC